MIRVQIDLLASKQMADTPFKDFVSARTEVTTPGDADLIPIISGAVTKKVQKSNLIALANDAVTYAKMQNVSAASKLLGRGSASGSGDVQEITLGINLFMSGTTLNATGGSVVSGIFNVKDYGAVGDGSTDDTTAINSAIAALNAAGNGTLYFPSGIYKVTSTLTTITANGSVRGDGMAQAQGLRSATSITCTSASATLFTVNNGTVKFQDLALINTSGGATSGSTGIKVISSGVSYPEYTKVDVDSVFISSFYINFDRQQGAAWKMSNFNSHAPVSIGLRVNNTETPDAGDWAIEGSFFSAFTSDGVPSDATQILLAGSGGGKISDTKLIGGAYGIDATPASTSILAITNSSIELFTHNGIRITGPGWANVTISNIEMSANPGSGAYNAILFDNTTRGIIGGIGFLYGDGSTAAIGLINNCSDFHFGPLFNQLYGRLIDTDGTYTGHPLPDAKHDSPLVMTSNSIQPEYEVFPLTCGGHTLENIYLASGTMSPWNRETHEVKFLVTDHCEWNASGNIGNAGTAEANTMVIGLYYYNYKWYLK
ncbi:MAG TPA: glycosyl hydrolase family 28-related protein [Pyrinomonadaceae bacterium]